MVLFSNEIKFVEETVISIFMLRNLVPTLLVDVNHSIHSKSYKGKCGVIHCCAPLFYYWFGGHLPRHGAFVDTQCTLKWDPRLMGLTSKDIEWYKHDLSSAKRKQVIFVLLCLALCLV